MATWWSYERPDPPRPGSYTIFVRLDGHGYEGALYHPAWQKPYRKVVERLTGSRWRIRTSHRVLDGILSPDQWRRSEIVADSTALILPPDMAPGRYAVAVR